MAGPEIMPEGNTPTEGGTPPGVPKGAAEISQAAWGGKNPLESVRGQSVEPPGGGGEGGISVEDLTQAFRQALADIIPAQAAPIPEADLPDEIRELPPAMRNRSLFDQAQWRISRFGQVPANETPDDAQTRQESLAAADQERERLMEEFNGEELFDEAKEEIFDIAKTLRNAFSWRELTKGRELNRYTGSIIQGEHEGGRFWSDVTRVELMGRAMGAVNFFYEVSGKIIKHIIQNPPDPNDPRPLTLPNIPGAELVARLWNHAVQRPNGEVRNATNLAEVVEEIERERGQMRLYDRIRGGLYEMHEFLIHHMNELPRAQEQYIEDSAVSFGGSNLDKMHEELQTRASDMDRMFKDIMGIFRITMEDEVFKRLRSAGHAMFNVYGSSFFGGKGKEGARAFFHYLGGLVQAVDNKPEFSNSIESLLFDPEGLNCPALELVTANDGVLIRQGVTQADPVGLRGERRRFETRQVRAMIEWLATHKLKRFEDLINHPAYQRLKQSLDRIEGLSADPNTYNQEIQTRRAQDATYLTNWEIYSKLATGGFSEQELAVLSTQMRQRVEDFTYKPKHKLARRLSEAEFWDMYEELTPDELADGELMAERRIKGRNALRWAERINRTFLVDSRFGIARLKLENGGNKPVILEIRDSLRILIDNDTQQPVEQQLFKISNLFRKVGMDLTLPIYGGFHLGGDDQERQDSIRALIQRDPELNRLLQAEMAGGMKDKDVIMKWLEEERRVIRLIERFVRYKNDYIQEDPERAKTTEGVKVEGYFNFKGGVKDWKNLISGPWGISTSGVKVKGLVKAADFYVRDFLYMFGCWTWREFVPILERDDEVQYYEEGPLFSEPLDAVFWRQMLERALNARSAWVSKGKREGGAPPGILQGGPIQGAWTIRPVIYPIYSQGALQDKWTEGKAPINQYALSYDSFQDAAQTTTRAEYIKTTAAIANKIEDIMTDKEFSETVYPESPETQLFEDTLLAHDITFWMATSREYSEPYGYADEARSPAAREYYKTFWRESGLIYADDKWKRIVTDLTQAIRDRGVNLPDMLESERRADQQFVEVFKQGNLNQEGWLGGRFNILWNRPKIPKL